MSEREREEALAALTGLSRASCPDVRERAHRVAAELNRRIDDLGLGEPVGHAEVNIRESGEPSAWRVRVGAVGVTARFDGTKHLFVKVGAHGKKPERFDERVRGFDYDRIVASIERRMGLEAKHAERLARRQRATDLGEALAKNMGPLRSELYSLSGVATRKGPVYRVTIDVPCEEDAVELALCARRLRADDMEEEDRDEEEKES